MSIYISRYVISRKELKDLFDKYKTVLEDRRTGARPRAMARILTRQALGPPGAGVEKLGEREYRVRVGPRGPREGPGQR